MNFIINANCAAAFAVLVSCATLAVGDEIGALELKVERAIDDFSEACYGVKARDGGWGSAVLISGGGRFLSSAHLFQTPGESATIYQVGGVEISARVVRLDHDLDVALLRMDDPSRLSRGAVVIPLRSQAKTDGPVEVLAFGHASGFRKGRRAPFRFGFAYENVEGQIVSNCHLTIGDSGGALLSLDGELLGIHRTVDRKGGYASHVPVALILKRWPDIAGAGL